MIEPVVNSLTSMPTIRSRCRISMTQIGQLADNALSWIDAGARGAVTNGGARETDELI